MSIQTKKGQCTDTAVLILRTCASSLVNERRPKNRRELHPLPAHREQHPEGGENPQHACSSSTTTATFTGNSMTNGGPGRTPSSSFSPVCQLLCGRKSEQLPQRSWTSKTLPNGIEELFNVIDEALHLVSSSPDATSNDDAGVTLRTIRHTDRPEQFCTSESSSLSENRKELLKDHVRSLHRYSSRLGMFEQHDNDHSDNEGRERMGEDDEEDKQSSSCCSWEDEDDEVIIDISFVNDHQEALALKGGIQNKFRRELLKDDLGRFHEELFLSFRLRLDESSDRRFNPSSSDEESDDGVSWMLGLLEE